MEHEQVTGLLNLVRKLSSFTYVRGANVVGVAMVITAAAILALAAGRYDVPVREVLLAAPGIFAAVGAVWYNMLNSPDPMILLVNVIPVDDDGSPVVSEEYLYRSLADDAVRISPQQKHTGTGPVSSFVTPWAVDCASVASDAVVSFDVTNRGYQPVVLHEYRTEGEDIEETVVALSPENQFLRTIPDDEAQQSPGTGEATTPDRQQVRPSERLSEQLRLSDLIQGELWERDRLEFKLELYAGSGAPVDSVFVEIRPVKDGMGIEWITHRSRLHKRLRGVLSTLGVAK